MQVALGAHLAGGVTRPRKTGKACISISKSSAFRVLLQLELDMEQQTNSKSGKEYIKAVYCHPAYLTSTEYIMRNAGLDEAQAGIKIAVRNINNLI